MQCTLDAGLNIELHVINEGEGNVPTSLATDEAEVMFLDYNDIRRRNVPIANEQGNRDVRVPNSSAFGMPSSI